MAGISSKLATWAVAKQSAKGTPAATPVVRFALAGRPSLTPVKERARYAMTDTSRDQGESYTSSMYVAGDIPLYLHFDGFALLAYLALGSNADSGAGPDYTHTITPADSLPYFTCWRMVGNTIFERFQDCKMDRMAVESSAGAPAMATLGIQGIQSTFLAADPVLARLTSAGLLHMEAKDEFKFATVAQRLSSFSFEVTNAVSRYQADDYLPFDVDEGERAVSMSFGARFTGPTAFPKYREFFYGSDAGTAMVPSVGTFAVDVTYVRTAVKSIKVSFPQVSYSTGLDPQGDPGGAPIDLSPTCEVEKPSASPVTTIVVKDQTATI